jgi:hypothetical protein
MSFNSKNLAQILKQELSKITNEEDSTVTNRDHLITIGSYLSDLNRLLLLFLELDCSIYATYSSSHLSGFLDYVEQYNGNNITVHEISNKLLPHLMEHKNEESDYPYAIFTIKEDPQMEFITLVTKSDIRETERMEMITTFMKDLIEYYSNDDDDINYPKTQIFAILTDVDILLFDCILQINSEANMVAKIRTTMKMIKNEDNQFLTDYDHIKVVSSCK